MLIPRFSLTQTATQLSITIRCPYVKLSSSTDGNENGIEVDLSSSNEFYFACKPYYLHLYLPGRVIDKGSPDYTYDIETSSFCFVYDKESINEHFENLDMMTRLLHRNEKKTRSSAIEEIDSIENSTTEHIVDDNGDDDDDEPLWNQMRQLEIDGR
jgi:hypothetical protein